MPLPHFTLPEYTTAVCEPRSRLHYRFFRTEFLMQRFKARVCDFTADEHAG